MSQPPLDYRSPRIDPPSKHNRWWKVLLRILAGVIAGAGATIVGVLIANGTRSALLASLPFALLFIAASYISVRYRRIGYTGGLILAPFLTAAVVVLLILWSCSHTHW